MKSCGGPHSGGKLAQEGKYICGRLQLNMKLRNHSTEDDDMAEAGASAAAARTAAPAANASSASVNNLGGSVSPGPINDSSPAGVVQALINSWSGDHQQLHQLIAAHQQLTAPMPAPVQQAQPAAAAAPRIEGVVVQPGAEPHVAAAVAQPLWPAATEAAFPAVAAGPRIEGVMVQPDAEPDVAMPGDELEPDAEPDVARQPRTEGVMVQGITAGFNASQDFACGFCGRLVTVMKLRLFTKGGAGKEPVWKCDVCNTRIVQLARAFSGWPTESFKGLDKEAKQLFMREIASAKGARDVLTKASKLLQSYEEHEEFYAEGGDFLPLEVWQSRGFNSDNILTRSKEANIRMCPVLGRTFRVPIISGGKRGVKGSRRVDELESSGQAKQLKKQLKKLKKEIGDKKAEQPDVEEDGNEGEGADDSESAGGSSDSDVSSSLPKEPVARAKAKAKKKLVKQQKKDLKKKLKDKAAQAAVDKAAREAKKVLEKQEAARKKEADKAEAAQKKLWETTKKAAQVLLPLVSDAKAKMVATFNHDRAFTHHTFHCIMLFPSMHDIVCAVAASVAADGRSTVLDC